MATFICLHRALQTELWKVELAAITEQQLQNSSGKWHSALKSAKRKGLTTLLQCRSHLAWYCFTRCLKYSIPLTANITYMSVVQKSRTPGQRPCIGPCPVFVVLQVWNLLSKPSGTKNFEGGHRVFEKLWTSRINKRTKIWQFLVSSSEKKNSTKNSYVHLVPYKCDGTFQVWHLTSPGRSKTAYYL